MTTATATTTSECFEYIRHLVREKSAIVLEPHKAYLVESRLLPVARQNALESISQLVAMMRRPGSQRLVQQVVEAMTTNETSFFRDVHPFDSLRTEILPKLVQKRSAERTLTIWSNACSSGQEVYTIAMLIKEHFPQLAGWKLRLIASDLSTQILDKAKSGVFNQTEVNRGLPLPLLLKYFQKSGLNWQIKDELRQMIDFRVLNLVEPFPVLPPVDVVFLRNVLIYFSPERKREILNRVSRTMRADGFLFLGGAETTMNLDVGFQRIQAGKSVCYTPTDRLTF